jgi:DNA primase
MIPKVDRRHDSERRPPYGLRKAIEVIKDVIPIEQVAAEYGEFKLLGNGRLLGRCVAQDHDDRTPSLTIYTNSQRFKCYGCGLSGDVIDLEEIAGQHLETWTAVVALSKRYGVELPDVPSAGISGRMKNRSCATWPPKPARPCAENVSLSSWS